jgi:hypothetical protein
MEQKHKALWRADKSEDTKKVAEIMLLNGKEREAKLKSGVVPELERGLKKERKRKERRKKGRNKQK